MGIPDEIKKMQTEGRSEQEIISTLTSQGYNQQQVYDAISQAKIKNAVTASDYNSSQEEEYPQQEKPSGMQPSLLNPASAQETAPQETAPSPEQYTSYSQQAYSPQQQYGNQDYSQYSQPSVSIETISEISDQVVSERMKDLRNDIEKIIDFKNAVESRMNYLDERLTKIEKIIDRLQLSILQKVGEYVANVEDMKNELSETQKSFKSLVNKSYGKKDTPEKSKLLSQEEN